MIMIKKDLPKKLKFKFYKNGKTEVYLENEAKEEGCLRNEFG
jgi:hypothetical protein